MFDYLDLKKALLQERAANERMKAELTLCQQQIAELTDAAIELAEIITDGEDDG